MYPEGARSKLLFWSNSNTGPGVVVVTMRGGGRYVLCRGWGGEGSRKLNLLNLYYVIYNKWIFSSITFPLACRKSSSMHCSSGGRGPGRARVSSCWDVLSCSVPGVQAETDESWPWCSDWWARKLLTMGDPGPESVSVSVSRNKIMTTAPLCICYACMRNTWNSGGLT